MRRRATMCYACVSLLRASDRWRSQSRQVSIASPLRGTETARSKIKIGQRSHDRSALRQFDPIFVGIEDRRYSRRWFQASLAPATLGHQP
jgi:hypothetical protein